jgi:hypothetical protein
MKKIVLATLLSVIATSSFAYNFRAQARTYCDRTQCQVMVTNTLPQPIYCEGGAQGVTVNGQSVWSNMSTTIYPGSYAYVYVYTNNYNPFRGVRHNITCSTY